MSSVWHRLESTRDELVLAHTLPTGQTFRWRRLEQGGGPCATFVGVAHRRAYALRQLRGSGAVEWRVVARAAGEVVCLEADRRALEAYLGLDQALAPLVRAWAAADAHYASVAGRIRGVRLLRQPPVECLFQFICSSNNHISRIGAMVEHLATVYGDSLVNEPGLENAQGLEGLFSTKHGHGGGDFDPPRFWAFPTLSQLARADEAALRAAGFGYRARYVASAARSLLDKEVEDKRPSTCRGEAWLNSLRGPAVPSARAVEELCSLAGVGPKVAACVALFALNHTALVPVDVHVHRLAGRHYLPGVKSAALTPALHPLIQEAFVRRFGEFAGWAHNALFVSQLRGVQLEEEGEEGEGAAEEEGEGGEGAVEDEAVGAKADENEAVLARKRALGSPTIKIDPDTPVQDVQDAPKQKRRDRSRG